MNAAGRLIRSETESARHARLMERDAIHSSMRRDEQIKQRRARKALFWIAAAILLIVICGLLAG